MFNVAVLSEIHSHPLALTVFLFLFSPSSVQHYTLGWPAGQKDATAGRGMSIRGVWPDRVHKCTY